MRSARVRAGGRPANGPTGATSVAGIAVAGIAVAGIAVAGIAVAGIAVAGIAVAGIVVAGIAVIDSSPPAVETAPEGRSAPTDRLRGRPASA